MEEIIKFSVHNHAADDLIERSYLSDELKRAYISGYHYRQSMIRIE